jgi:hypothetical protein
MDDRLRVWRMRTFYLASTKDIAILPQTLAELDGTNLSQAVTQIASGHKIKSNSNAR